jgi:HEPN domain-containing protein
MPNKQSAREWLEIAQHDLKAAGVLFENDHYTDTIGYLLQQSLEKMLKAVSAYHNYRIKKTHDLVEIYDLARTSLSLEEQEVDYLESATIYYVENRYPNAFIALPTKEEIKQILNFARELFTRICTIIGIEQSKLS